MFLFKHQKIVSQIYRFYRPKNYIYSVRVHVPIEMSMNDDISMVSHDLFGENNSNVCRCQVRYQRRKGNLSVSLRKDFIV